MALIAYSPLVDEIRGSISNITFSNCRSGRFARYKVRPTDPLTGKQNTARQYFAAAVDRWVNVLSSAQRLAWNNLGDATTYYNSAGQAYNPSGINLFTGVGSFLQHCGETMITVAPAAARVPAVDFQDTIFIDSVSSEFTNDAPWPPNVTGYILGRESPPTSLGTYYYIGPWAKQDVEDIEIVRIDGLWAPANFNSHVIGARYHFLFQYIETTGELSYTQHLFGDVTA